MRTKLFLSFLAGAALSTAAIVGSGSVRNSSAVTDAPVWALVDEVREIKILLACSVAIRGAEGEFVQSTCPRK